MNRADDLQKADFLLVDWYEWSRAYRPKLGAPRCAPYCRESTPNRQYDDSTEASCGNLHTQQMEAVEFCIDQIGFDLQRAVGIEMRNRQGAKVWRGQGAPLFAKALDALLPIMRKRGLFD